MSYKTKAGKLVRVEKRILTLYHFTPPENLPSILADGICPSAEDRNDHMLPGSAAVWLTADPNGNQVTEAHLDHARNHGNHELVAEYESGRRRFLFGENETGSARITVRLSEKFEGLFHYLSLMTANYENDSPEALAVVAAMPGVGDWWVLWSPGVGESFRGIGPGVVTEVHPVGDPSPEYLAAINAIMDAAERDDEATA
jgi:hypothetical protein